MNKSRAVMARQARQLAAIGIDSLIFDLYGTGDSAGQFSDATWDAWRDDLLSAWLWLEAQGVSSIHCVAVRSGALLLDVLSANRDTSRSKLVLWQPVTNGGLYWKQFMRLRIAAESIRGGNDSVSPAEILRRDGRVEISGYTVSALLAGPMAASKLDLSCIAPFAQVLWVEMLMSATSAVSPAGQRIVDEWQKEGLNVVMQGVGGEYFWATPELAGVPQLHAATNDFFLAPSEVIY